MLMACPKCFIQINKRRSIIAVQNVLLEEVTSLGARHMLFINALEILPEVTELTIVNRTVSPENT